MKSKLKSIVILLIIIVLCLSVGVYAGYTLSATEVSYTKSDGTTISVKDALDELHAKEKEIPKRVIGDIVLVGDELFYVLEWENNRDTVDLIAKYNLNSDGTAQSSSQVSCVFSSTNYWSSSFTSRPFNLNDFSGYKSTDVIGKAKSYGESKGAVASRLLSYEEASAIRIKSSSNAKIKNMYANGQKYWLGSADTKYRVYHISETGSPGGADYDYGKYGIRPVITVLKSSIY